MEESASQFNRMQQLKRSLYAMRNGVVADSLRKAGCPHRIVFGLNLPQLTEIAYQYAPDEHLAEELWRDTALRESALLAPMLYPLEKLTFDKAWKLVMTTVWHEDADILCFKLLRHADFAPELAEKLAACDISRMARYTGLRLYFSLVSREPQKALAAAQNELQRPDALTGLASMLREEALFVLGV